jgi:hypothetical protein
MFMFFGIGPQELIIISGICCLFALPAIVAVAVIAMVANSQRKQRPDD